MGLFASVHVYGRSSLKGHLKAFDRPGRRGRADYSGLARYVSVASALANRWSAEDDWPCSGRHPCYADEIESDAVSDTPPSDALPAPHPERKAADHTSVKSDLAAAAANIAFQDPQAARPILSRLRAHLSPELAAAVPALLREAPDPDSALISFERLVSEPSGEMQRLLNQHHFLAHYAIVVFGHSRFLGETLIQNPDLLQTFLRERNLDHSFSREEFHESLARFRSRSFENDVSLLLAHFKRREYVRIMLRDVLRLAPLAETTAEISALSDVLIEEALREADSKLQRRHGTPQHLDALGRLVDTPFAVLALGKLGGNEL